MCLCIGPSARDPNLTIMSLSHTHYSFVHITITIPQKQPQTGQWQNELTLLFTFILTSAITYLESLSLQSISLSYSADKWPAVGDNHRSLNTSNICRAVLQSLTTRDKTHAVSLTHTHTHSPQSCWIPPNRVRVGKVFVICFCRCDFKDGLEKEVGKMRGNTHTQSDRCLLINSDSFMALTHKSRTHNCWKCSVIKSKLNSLVCVCVLWSPW